MRQALVFLCIVSGILFLILGGILFNAALEAIHTPAAGIIGGADLPTLGFFLEQILRSPAGIAAAAAFLIFCGSGLMLIFHKA